MYNLPYFKDKDPGAVLDFIRQHPFAFIAGCTPEGVPVATQIPVFIEERDGELFLTGHMMKQTDHHKAFERNREVLCVFTGAHSYVSATWYSDPKQASTWNYMSVHVRGELSFLGEQELIDVLQKTSLHFEGGNKASSTTYDNLPHEYRTKLLKAIVAFEVKVNHMDHVFKLSQNRDKESYGTIINKLSEGDAEAKAVADEMRSREGQVFPRN
jgi:transcriptional regulator